MTAMMSALEDCRQLPDLNGNSFRWWIGESDNQVEIFPGPLSVETLVQFQGGVAFGPGSELRWRKRANGAFHIVLIDDHGTVLPMCTEEHKRELRKLGESEVLLWGTVKRNGLHFDTRIPRPIKYPEAENWERVAVRLVHYRFKDKHPEWAEGGLIWQDIFQSVARMAELKEVDR